MRGATTRQAASAMWTLLAGMVLMAGIAPRIAHAAPSLETPRRDSDIVEVLRERPLSDEERAWRSLRQRARQAPTDATLAIQVAHQALQWARRDGDPRLLGQARAALAHWWTQLSPPADIRLLRATILQSTHDFDAALKDLDALIEADPRHQQAWLTRAAVLQVQGRYPAAQAACEGLAKAGAVWPARVCRQELRSYTGQATEAMAELAVLVTQAPRDMATHILLVRAELAERLGQPELAARLYAISLAQSGQDAYAEGAYADLLLDQGKADQVITMLKGRERNDALLLRLAQAYQERGDPAGPAAIRALDARFAAAHLRGDSVHQREEARFRLRLMKQPRQALALAQRNWQVQKEPADARILIEAAQAAGQGAAADEVRRFIDDAGWTDRRLEAQP